MKKNISITVGLEKGAKSIYFFPVRVKTTKFKLMELHVGW